MTGSHNNADERTIMRIAVERLFLIDQSLSSLGGHHFDYVNCVAKAASNEKLETYVAANRDFYAKGLNTADASTPLFRSTKVFPSFRNTTYQKVSWLAGLQHLKRSAVPPDQVSSNKNPFSLRSIFSRRRTRIFRKQRRKVIAQFACDCNRFFRTAATGEFRRGDHIFLTTVSELEMMGLAIFLSVAPSSRLATWHLQFHYNLFDGRPAEFDSQAMIQRKVRGCFLAALSRIPDHDVRMYCTSQELVEQYSRLDVAEFSQMPYPINPRFAPRMTAGSASLVKVIAEPVFAQAGESVSISSGHGEIKLATPLRDGPARMIVPGELRREKGSKKHLQSIVDGLWDDYFSTGRLQVAVQRPKRRLIRGEKLELKVPDRALPNGSEPAIDYLRHPLSESRYCDFIRGCDFGLLLHDSRAYYSRRAGVLGELMSCGKPVIVPAGCWLAQQLQESHFQHIRSVNNWLPVSRTLDLRGIQFDSSNAPLSGGVVSFDRSRHPFCAQVTRTEPENIAILSFNWHHQQSARFARIRCRQTGHDETFRDSVRVVGKAPRGSKCLAMFRLEASSEKVTFEFENAFDDSAVTICDLEVQLLESTNSDDVRMGFNGLIYADSRSIMDSIVEVVDNLDHYQRNAQTFASPWWRSHAPRRTLNRLLGFETMEEAA